MSFHFKKLNLKNWLVYGGEVELSFSDYMDGQNIVTIHGQNGFGKTSLLRALEFLFHDKYNREDYFDLWHENAREAGNGEEGNVVVSLEFDYRQTPLKLIREIEFKPWRDTVSATSSLTLINVETGEPEDQAEDKVELIIPEMSQQFVFFDGAEITRYAQKQHKEGVREAIERMLGIPAVRNLSADLSKLIAELEDQQAEIAILEDESQELVQEIDGLQDELANYRTQKEDKEEKLQTTEQAADEIEKEAAQIAAIESEQRQLDEKRKRLADFEERRAEKTKQIEEFLRNAPLYMLEKPLTQIVQEGQAQYNGGNSRFGTYRQQKKFLESLLSEEDCVCGRPITSETESKIRSEVIRLSELTERMDGQDSNRLFSFTELSSLAGKLERLRDHNRNGEELFDQRSAIDERIEEIETDIRRLERKLEGHENASVRDNIRLQRELAQKAAGLGSEIEGLEENIQRVAAEIRKKQRRLDEATTGTAEGRQITKTLKKARKLSAAVEEFVTRLVEEKRSSIEKNASEIFRGITNKPQEYAGVRVNDDYTLQVYRNDGTTVENDKLSAGEKEVLAYSFITALNLSSPTPAPFLMDTPFGHLDSIHRDRLLQSLPRLDVQVFLLATDRDLPDNERERIKDFIADEFIIRRNQREARSYIEPHDS